jgi:hypothetical protein
VKVSASVDGFSLYNSLVASNKVSNLLRLVMFKGFALLEASFADEAFCDPLDELPPTASRLDFREC